MSSVQHQKKLLRERPADAAVEIFPDVGKPVVRSEGELGDQRRMTGMNWKAQIKLRGIRLELQGQSSGRKRRVSSLQSLVSWYQEHSASCPHEPQLRALEPKPDRSTAAVWHCVSDHVFVLHLYPPLKEVSNSEQEERGNGDSDGEAAVQTDRPSAKGPGGRQRRKEGHKKWKDELIDAVNQTEEDGGENQQPRMEASSTALEGSQLVIITGPSYEASASDGVRLNMGGGNMEEVTCTVIGSVAYNQLCTADFKVRAAAEEDSLTDVQNFSTIQQVNKRRRSSHDQKEPELLLIKREDPEPPRIKEEEEEPELSWIKKEEEDPEPSPIEKQEEPECPLIDLKKEEPHSSVFKYEQQEPEHLANRQDQGDFSNSQEGEQLVQKQSIALIETSSLQDGDLSEGEPRTEQLSFPISPVAESKDQEGSSSTVSESQSHTDSKKTSFKCDICGRCFESHNALENHYRTHTGEKTFSCQSCGKRFYLIDSLNRHNRIHTGERPFSCETCGKSFTRSSHLNEHMKTHTGVRPFSCKTCGKSFIRGKTLDDHMRTHTGERPFSCKKCGKSFTRSTTLNDHMKIHTGERPFSCKTCGKSFRQSSTLNNHMRLHTDERPLSCKTCGKCFKQRSALYVHIRTHTGEKPFSCETCGKCFTWTFALNEHMKTHSDLRPFSCETCGKSYKQRDNLKVHMRKHIGERPFSCETCGKSFGQSSTMNEHMKTHRSEAFSS